MSISSISSFQTARLAELQAHVQAQADLKTLNGDLRAGNLAGAQTDFATLLKDAPQLQQQLSSGSNAPEASALTALSSALQSGNIPSAQTAAASLQAAMGRRDHHPHLNQPNPLSSASAPGVPTLQVRF
jgi:hypothetical protein